LKTEVGFALNIEVNNKWTLPVMQFAQSNFPNILFELSEHFDESGTIAWQSPDPVSLQKVYSFHSEFIAKSYAVRRASEATV